MPAPWTTRMALRISSRVWFFFISVRLFGFTDSKPMKTV